jgi:cyclophilin family peptidyl-prolyl cis-trans isomerase
MTFRLSMLPAAALVWTLLGATPALADLDAARAAMRSSVNPLLQFESSAGTFYVELYRDQAPTNVQRVLQLVEGQFPLQDSATGSEFTPRYYNGLTFHRQIPGLLLQLGSPLLHPLGGPPLMAEEISAASLGLDSMPALLPDGQTHPALNITDRESLASLLLDPLYQELGIESLEQLREQQEAVYERLQALSVQDVLELQGYSYRQDLESSPVVRGSVLLANSGPGGNRGELSFVLDQAPWMTGRYTVIGQLVDGVDIVDELSRSTPSAPTFRPVLYRVSRVDLASSTAPGLP